MKKVLILQGLPASGKTTYARELVDNNPGVYKNVCKDDLRAMLDNKKWSRDNEAFILDLRDAIILQALEAGKHVIVSDTNLAPKHVHHIKKLVEGKAEVEVQLFDVPVEECIARDLKRENSVGEKVIRGMYEQFLKKPVRQYEPDTSLPSAYIFDIDGTLACMDSGRSPYDWHRVHEDSVNEEIRDVLLALRECGHKILIFTGRDGGCEDVTRKWLEDNNIPYDDFKMREAGNTEKDSVVKQRMLDDVKGMYCVKGVFDDRRHVMEMWREIGLRCFHVDYGDF